MTSIRFLLDEDLMPDVALRGMAPELHQALKAAAERNHRSLNGEILARLEASVRARPLDMEALLERVLERCALMSLPELDGEQLRTLKEEGRP